MIESVFKPFLDECHKHRIGAIYDVNYRYIKEIIWDDETQDKYGVTREGYEKYKDEHTGQYSYSGMASLREVKHDSGETTYFIEEKRPVNSELSYIINQYELAKAKLFEVLEVKDIKTFEIFLTEYKDLYFTKDVNTIISNIKGFENFLSEYNNDADFKRVIDKIKG